MRTKLYNSRAWLQRKYEVEKMAIRDIAELTGATEMTIYRKLHEFGLIKKR